MNNSFLYKVSSLITVDGENASKYVKLSKKLEKNGDVSPDTILVSLDNVKVGEEVRVSFTVTKSLENLTDLYFLHHFDRVNQGDILSGPYNYFSFSNYGFISWDKNILKNEGITLNTNFSVIMGGGIYFPKDKPRLKKIMKDAKYFIGWGLGLDSRMDLTEYVNQFSLLGTREKFSNFIDNKKIFYVPCSSCMNNFFVNYLSNNSFSKITKDIAIHLNHGFNEKEISNRFTNKDITYTTTDFNQSIKNMAEAEYVITNSYHGAYWSSLMGKKVICLATKVPKWDGLHENIIFTDIDQIDEALRKVKNVPLDYLKECQELNIGFYNKVMELLSK